MYYLLETSSCVIDGITLPTINFMGLVSNGVMTTDDELGKRAQAVAT